MTTTTTTISGGILPKEYQDLRDTVADFARTVVAPVSAKHDAEHSFPYEIVAKMGEMGLFGLPFPEEYGGMGGDYFALSLVLEELGKVDQSVAITLEAAVGLGAMPIYRFGTEEQKQKWLPDLTSGRALAGFGLTEPGAGSDAGSTRTTARLEGDEWIINGSKQFITNSGTDIISGHRHCGYRDHRNRCGCQKRFRRSSCPAAHRDSPWNRSITRSAGTPRTPTH